MAIVRGMSKEMYEHILANLGELVLDLERGLILNRKVNVPNTFGYLRIHLKGHYVAVHQILAVARWGERCIGMTVNHYNEDKLDNSWDNLDLVPHKINVKLKSKKGSGKRSPIKATNLSTGEIQIFKSMREAERVLGIHQSAISFIVNGVLPRCNGYFFERVVE